MNSPFSDLIESLEHEGTLGKYVRKRDSRISILNVFGAKEIGSGLDAMLVETIPEALRGISEWPQSEGFSVEIEKVEGTKAGTATRICLLLSEKKYRKVFFILCESICKSMIVATDSRDAIKSIHNLLFTWQQFLRKHSTDGLSEQARVGLFGELEILYSLFLKQLNKTVALEGWRGCKKAHQDFQYHDFALEVKTTRAVTPELINISNARQLDNENISSLFLTVVNVDQNPSSGISLQDQVERIRDCLSGASIDLFEEGLLKVGFLDKHKKSYEKELYSVKSISHFKISDGFPHILHSHIPEGVKQVKYKISISSCYSYKVENSFVAKSVKQLAQTLEDE